MGNGMRRAALALACFGIAAATAAAAPVNGVEEIQLDWAGLPVMAGHPPSHAFGDGMGMAMGAQAGSTHEIAFAPGKGAEAVISGQNYGGLAHIRPGQRTVYQRLPLGSGPHGLGYDKDGLLWVTLEFAGRVVAFDPDGKKVRDIDVRIACHGCAVPLNPHPHGLAVVDSGRAVWATGKATGTVSRIDASTAAASVATYQLPTTGSTPIYIRQGPDLAAPPGGTQRETMWVTELTGNAIASVSVAATKRGAGPPPADIVEYRIPTANSRPIAVEKGPDGRMWFTEEAGGKVGRIERDGKVSEFPLPSPAGRPQLLLAGLAFDGAGNLWVQQYAGHGDAPAPGVDRLIVISSRILGAAPGELKPQDFGCFPVPTADTVMHRIARTPDGAMWFTEMNANKVGRVDPNAARQACS